LQYFHIIAAWYWQGQGPPAATDVSQTAREQMHDFADYELKGILDTVVEALKAERAFIGLIDAETRKLTPQKTHGLQAGDDVGTLIAMEVVKNRVGIVSDDTVDGRPRTMIAIPFNDPDGNTIGVVYADKPVTQGSFTQSDINNVSALINPDEPIQPISSLS